MSFNRYEPENDPEKITDTNHFSKFIKKVKKRHLVNKGYDKTLFKKKNKSNGLKKEEESGKSDEKIINDDLRKDLSLNNTTTVPKESISENFTIIGDYTFNKSEKVKPVLPKWLSNPQLIPVDLSEVSNEFPNFNPVIISNLKENGISQLFPVQQSVIPWIRQQSGKANLLNYKFIPRDICVSSPTGSGKTLAYVLPVVEGLINRLVPRIRCLVIVPVQELALQVAKVFCSYIKGTRLRVEAVTGGRVPLQVEQDRLLKKIKGQNESYESLVDIVVITPGRLVEHLQKTNGFNLKSLKYLIIDEADRMMDGIQNDWLFYLEKHLGQEIHSSLSLTYLYKKRTKFQKLLFSATLSHDPEKLEKLNLFQPILFTSTNNKFGHDVSAGNNDKEQNSQFVGKFVMPKELEEYYIVVDNFLKPLVIAELLSAKKWRMVLCFCKSASEANRLSKLVTFLCPTLKVKDISSLLHKTSRNSVLNQFSNGEIDMLVSSDVMARGIDIPKVRYVISYDAPKYLRGYVHRAGRTGRAGVKGTVLTLTTPSQVASLTQQLQQANRINVKEMKMSLKVFQKRSKAFKVALNKLRLSSEATRKNTMYSK